MGFIESIKSHLANLPGWRTNKKIVVFESDDWGSIRMPSREVYKALMKRGIRVDQLSYNRYDSLASVADLSALFEVLSSVQDKNGRPAILTANTLAANPDFEKIEADDFSDYHYEPFTETLKRYAEHGNSFSLWKEGMQAGLFRPQFHGREHLNVQRWLRALRENTGHTRLAFDLRMFDLSTSLVIGENSFMEALNFEDAGEVERQKDALLDGLDLFEEIFGYRATTFIPPCYTWSSRLDAPLYKAGIKAYQSGWFQREPLPGKSHRFKKRFHYTGQRNRAGQYYLVRNAAFEPADRPDFDWVDDVLGRMEIIFRCKKPAIISTHRLNFIGFIDEDNRDRNLRLFRTLLNKMLRRWPDIEFMSSDQLLGEVVGSG